MAERKGRRKHYVGQGSVTDAAFATDRRVDGLFALGNRTDFSCGRRPTVRLYIEAESGVTVDDCAQVSHQVSGILDVEDPITGEHTLEVSQFGVDRLLFHPEHYPLYIGEMIDVRLRLPVEGRRRYKGNSRPSRNRLSSRLTIRHMNCPCGQSIGQSIPGWISTRIKSSE